MKEVSGTSEDGVLVPEADDLHTQGSLQQSAEPESSSRGLVWAGPGWRKKYRKGREAWNDNFWVERWQRKKLK